MLEPPGFTDSAFSIHVFEPTSSHFSSSFLGLVLSNVQHLLQVSLSSWDPFCRTVTLYQAHCSSSPGKALIISQTINKRSYDQEETSIWPIYPPLPTWQLQLSFPDSCKSRLPNTPFFRKPHLQDYTPPCLLLELASRSGRSSKLHAPRLSGLSKAIRALSRTNVSALHLI